MAFVIYLDFATLDDVLGYLSEVEFGLGTAVESLVLSLVLGRLELEDVDLVHFNKVVPLIFDLALAHTLLSDHAVVTVSHQFINNEQLVKPIFKQVTLVAP